MKLDRRQVLAGVAGLALTGGAGVIGKDLAIPSLQEKPEPFHPLTRSLLDRARRVGSRAGSLDRAIVEDTVRRFSEKTSRESGLVIEWLDGPEEAFDRLSRIGLEGLLAMGETNFWSLHTTPSVTEAAWCDSASSARLMAGRLLRVEDHDRLLMAPKLAAKSHAVRTGCNLDELYRVRAASAQIGWLETSMADAAARAVGNVEMRIGSGLPADDASIYNQILVFEAHEQGLLASWETPSALLCVPATAT